MPHSVEETAPPFPSGLREAPIKRIPLASLLTSDPDTEKALETACRTHGFFYLDLTTCDVGKTLLDDAETLHSIAKDAFKVSPEVKDALAAAKQRELFGHKSSGITAKNDPHKRSDKGEFWNVSKDDMLDQYPNPVPYPEEIMSQKAVFQHFMRTSHETGMLVLDVLARHLGISPAELKARHKIQNESGDHVRLTWGPGDPGASVLPKEEKDVKITTFGHTDFGSVTLLFNWLGGLQIENSAGEWEWVRPQPGCAICNMGDAMVTFAGGKVNSGKHRVVAAPGEQAKLERYSIVYFVRPEDNVVLEDISPDAVKKGEGEKKWTAKEWIAHQARYLGNNVKKEAGVKEEN